MSAAAKLAGFLLLLGAVFGVAAVAGGAIDPDRGAESADRGGAHGDDGGPDAAGHDADGATGGADRARGVHGGGADAVRGLAVAQDGLRLVVATPELPARRDARLAFRIAGRDGRAVRDYDVEHERRMHVIVARRDLSGFQHLHPRMAADGTWSAPIRIAAPGSYRVFADFSAGGQARTLAADLRVDGPADLRPLPAPAATAVSDGGDTVALRDGGRPPRAGRDATLRFSIERDGAPVALERYLGAGGHLVALREGDLAFLHVHPTGPAPAAAGADHAHAPGEQHGDGTGAPAGADDAARTGQVAFQTAFPTPGRYRLFLQYQVAGQVRTAAFTVEVAR